MDFAYEDADYPEGQQQQPMEVDDNGDVEAEEGGEEEMNQMDDEPVTQEDAWAAIRYVTIRYDGIEWNDSVVCDRER
jgi:hypothetical protein